jgi:hypothetical protein
MNVTTDDGWLNFDIHGVVGVRVHSAAPPALQLQTMMGSFAVDNEVADDVVVRGDLELMLDAAIMDDELVYNSSAVLFRRNHVQVVRDGTQYRVNGPGALPAAVLPVIDLAMAKRDTAMIHAASIGCRGRAIALPAARGIGMAGTIAGLTKRPGYSFMGDAWAFVTEDGRLLNYEKPMSIGRDDRSVYPHLFQGGRRPMVPPRVSRPLDRFTAVVQPHMVKYPKLAGMSRRMSPEHRTVLPRRALPGVPVTREAPLLMAAFVERYEGARTRVAEQDSEWMGQRLLGNFNIALPRFSQDVLAGLAATSHLSLASYFEDKARVLAGALAETACFVVQVPSVYSPGLVSEEIVRVVEDLLRTLVAEGRAPSGVSVA